MKKLVIVAIVSFLFVAGVLINQEMDYQDRVVKCVQHERIKMLVKYAVVGTALGAALGVATLMGVPFVSTYLGSSISITGTGVMLPTSTIVLNATSGTLGSAFAYLFAFGHKPDRFVKECYKRTPFWG